MNIEEQFNLIAEEYDKGRRKFIPCFEDYYENTTAFLAENIAYPKCILDLGAGTGLLSWFWYRHFPNAKYVLVDIADEMLNVAKRRFNGLDQVSYQSMDYTNDLPNEAFDCMISALSIHHLEQQQKAVLFKRIYEKLPLDGIFVNYDQFCSDSAEINRYYNTYWEKQIEQSGLSKLDFERWQERRKLDKECSVAEEIKMLKESGFTTVECIYVYQKFAVIIAKKEGCKAHDGGK